MDAELLFHAADESRTAPQPFQQIKKLVSAWHDAGVATVSAAQQFEQQRASAPAAQQRKPRLAKAHNHHERAYSDEELAKIGIDLLED